MVVSTVANASQQQTVLYGAAYYEEYAPYDRLNADIEMMKSAGITVVRIGESTWGTLEPHDGIFRLISCCGLDCPDSG
jgi:beta-galactosidase